MKPPLQTLVHLALNIARKHFHAAGYRKKILNRKIEILFASLTDHSCKARNQTKQLTVTILQHKNKLTCEMCLLGFLRVCYLCTLPFLLPPITLFVFFKQWNRINVLISPINTFLEQHI